MLNVLIPITNNAHKFNKLLERLNGDFEIDVRVGITKSQAGELQITESDNISLFLFEDGAKREEILNSLSIGLVEGGVMVIRKPITFDEFKEFCRTKSEITTCKKTYSKIGGFFHKLWQKILKLCLGVKLYEGDTSVIRFDENIGTVLVQTQDLSYATRVDRWKGLETETVDTKEEGVKAEIDKKAIIKSALYLAGALIVGLVTTLCVCLLTKVSTIGGLLLICLDAICLFIMFLMVVIICFNCKVGKKYNKKADNTVKMNGGNYEED